MHFLMAPGTAQRERALAAGGQVPLAVPSWYADRVERQQARAEFEGRGHRIAMELAEKERRKKDTAFQEDQNRSLRNTKPVAYMDDSDPDRPVMVVGAGTEWREDLRELAFRTKEKPDPKKNPIHRERADILNRLDMMAEANKWRKTGRSAVWHITNNPCRSD